MALAISPVLADPLPGADEYPDVAFLARNDVPFDAQTAASVTAQLGAPMFITSPTTLSNAASEGIGARNPDVIIVAGGTAAISEEVAEQAAAVCSPDCPIDRFAGTGRDETAAALADIADKYGFQRRPRRNQAGRRGRERWRNGQHRRHHRPGDPGPDFRDVRARRADPGGRVPARKQRVSG